MACNGNGWHGPLEECFPLQAEVFHFHVSESQGQRVHGTVHMQIYKQLPGHGRMHILNHVGLTMASPTNRTHTHTHTMTKPCVTSTAPRGSFTRKPPNRQTSVPCCGTGVPRAWIQPRVVSSSRPVKPSFSKRSLTCRTVRHTRPHTRVECAQPAPTVGVWCQRASSGGLFRSWECSWYGAAAESKNNSKYIQIHFKHPQSMLQAKNTPCMEAAHIHPLNPLQRKANMAVPVLSWPLACSVDQGTTPRDSNRQRYKVGRPMARNAPSGAESMRARHVFSMC